MPSLEDRAECEEEEAGRRVEVNTGRRRDPLTAGRFLTGGETLELFPLMDVGVVGGSGQSCRVVPSGSVSSQ